jgi:exo-1,4-beta-D-glucosaminidase
MTALNYLPSVALQVSAERTGGADAGLDSVRIRVRNPSSGVAFFTRAELLSSPESDEILPIEYSDNYVTVFPGETVTIDATVPTPDVAASHVRVVGYNAAPVLVEIR